jgi:hypothetical protein
MGKMGSERKTAQCESLGGLLFRPNFRYLAENTLAHSLSAHLSMLASRA